MIVDGKSHASPRMVLYGSLTRETTSGKPLSWICLPNSSFPNIGVTECNRKPEGVQVSSTNHVGRSCGCFTHH